MAAGYAAWMGGRATWSIELGRDRVLFGYRAWRRFLMPVFEGRLTARACEVEQSLRGEPNCR